MEATATLRQISALLLAGLCLAGSACQRAPSSATASITPPSGVQLLAVSEATPAANGYACTVVSGGKPQACVTYAGPLSAAQLANAQRACGSASFTQICPTQGQTGCCTVSGAPTSSCFYGSGPTGATDDASNCTAHGGVWTATP